MTSSNRYSSRIDGEAPSILEGKEVQLMKDHAKDSHMRVCRRVALFVGVALVWLLLDIITKNIADDHSLGQVFGISIPGVFECRLVHNTGGAWGMFGDMTLALGVLSLVICALIVVFVFIYRNMSSFPTFALALIFAGGLGNAIDRFFYGYVIDFINLTFIDFPVFNIADIGVTCGIALFIISIVFIERDRSSDPALSKRDTACVQKVDHDLDDPDDEKGA